jgi:hypothetical protein
MSEYFPVCFPRGILPPPPGLLVLSRYNRRPIHLAIQAIDFGASNKLLFCMPVLWRPARFVRPGTVVQSPYDHQLRPHSTGTWYVTCLPTENQQKLPFLKCVQRGVRGILLAYPSSCNTIKWSNGQGITLLFKRLLVPYQPPLSSWGTILHAGRSRVRFSMTSFNFLWQFT